MAAGSYFGTAETAGNRAEAREYGFLGERQLRLRGRCSTPKKLLLDPRDSA